MKNDPIVVEIHRIRDAHAAQFQYDLDAIFRDIKAREQASGKIYVQFPPRRIKLRGQETSAPRPGND